MREEPFTVRRLEERDAQGLARLFDLLGMTRGGVESFKARVEEAWVQELVAVDGEERVVGRVRFEYPWPPYGEVVNLGVAPDARRMGVGRLLVQACLDIARSQSIQIIHLQTDGGNLTAHRLYREQGFAYAIPSTRASKGLIGLLHVNYVPAVENFSREYPSAAFQRPRKAKVSPSVPRGYNLLPLIDPVTGDYLAAMVRGTPGQIDMPTIAGWSLRQGEVHWSAFFTPGIVFGAAGVDVPITLDVENSAGSVGKVEVSVESLHPPFHLKDASPKMRPTSVKPGGALSMDLRVAVPRDMKDRFSASSYPNIPITCHMRIGDQRLVVTGSALLGGAISRHTNTPCKGGQGESRDPHPTTKSLPFLTLSHW